MANFDFGEIKKKAAETAGVIADKTSTFAKRAKISAEIAAEKEHLKKAYQSVGQLYFEKYGNDPDPDFLQAVSEVSLSVEKIEAKKAELDELVEDGGVEIEITITKNSTEDEEPNTEAAPEAECCCTEEKSEETECACGCSEDKPEEPECACGEEQPEEKTEE